LNYTLATVFGCASLPYLIYIVIQEDSQTKIEHKLHLYNGYIYYTAQIVTGKRVVW